jgi:hypothetical protein
MDTRKKTEDKADLLYNNHAQTFFTGSVLHFLFSI